MTHSPVLYSSEISNGILLGFFLHLGLYSLKRHFSHDWAQVKNVKIFSLSPNFIHHPASKLLCHFILLHIIFMKFFKEMERRGRKFVVVVFFILYL